MPRTKGERVPAKRRVRRSQDPAIRALCQSKGKGRSVSTSKISRPVKRVKCVELAPDPKVVRVLGVDVGLRNMGYVVLRIDEGGWEFESIGLWDGAPGFDDPPVDDERLQSLAVDFARDVVAQYTHHGDTMVIAVEKQIPKHKGSSAEAHADGKCKTVEMGIHTAARMYGMRCVQVDPKHVKATFSAFFQNAGDYDENKFGAKEAASPVYTPGEWALIDGVVAHQKRCVQDAAAHYASQHARHDAGVERHTLLLDAAKLHAEDAHKRRVAAANADKPALKAEEEGATDEMRVHKTALLELRRTAPTTHPKPYKTDPVDMHDAALIALAVGSALCDRDLYEERLLRLGVL